jgi:hypothetical protein
MTMTTTTEVSAMNKVQIIAELENMVAARLFSDQPWPADWEAISALHRKLIQMGLVEQVSDELITWGATPLGKELNVDLFRVFLGLWYVDVPIILKEYGLIDESEFDAICECTSLADVDSLFSKYVKRAYFDYRNGGRRNENYPSNAAKDCTNKSEGTAASD